QLRLIGNLSTVQVLQQHLKGVHIDVLNDHLAFLSFLSILLLEHTRKDGRSSTENNLVSRNINATNTEDDITVVAILKYFLQVVRKLLQFIIRTTRKS